MKKNKAVQLGQEMIYEEMRDRLLKRALSYLGASYEYGAKRWDGKDIKDFPETFDCSSFVHALYLILGIEIPKRSIEQASFGKLVTEENLKIGDLIFFKSDTGFYNPEYPDGVGHVMMYIGNNQVIGACGNFPYKRKRIGQVAMFSLKLVLNRNDFRGVKRIIGHV